MTRLTSLRLGFEHEERLAQMGQSISEAKAPYEYGIRDSSISPYFAYMNMRCIRLAMMISITAVIKARFTQASDFLLSVSVHSVHLALPSGVKPFGS